ncbi:MAG: GNAT family N-acetyltransferase, partial [Saprospiraceae bacterium]|nr:GNAT family N-acetyltransferase [Saprospiraceae bacterium]
MIRLQPYNRTQLRALIDAPAFSELPFLPISYHRAISHIHNPRADQDDTLLIIAYDDQKMVGYLGILPDWIFDQSGNKSKCGWLSCMWIDPNCRGKGISKKLVAHALESWNQKILVTEFTGPAKGLYDKSGAFKDLQINEGIRLYIRADLSKLLPPKSQYFKKLKPFWQVIDLLFNKVFDIRFSFIHLPKPNWQYVSDIDQELNNFISGQQENQIFIRQREELNWILNYPWIISSNEDAMSQKYYFKTVAKTFEQKAIKLENESKEIVGF